MYKIVAIIWLDLQKGIVSKELFLKIKPRYTFHSQSLKSICLISEEKKELNKNL